MPLPERDQAWPPKSLAPVHAKLREWDAWWTGDPAALERVYRGTASPYPADRPAQRRGGVVGALARFWWGRPTGDGAQRRDDTHVPLAADIVGASADLLFSEPLAITAGDEATQKRLGLLLADEARSTLIGAAEQAAALGGVYLKTVFDREVADSAFLVSEPADRAIPEFWHGRLRAVTFWRIVRTDGQQVWRHLERHELDGGLGVVQHGLYAGTPDRLGRKVPLPDVDDLVPLAGSVNDEGYIVEGATPGLDVVYVPNGGAESATAWRHHPVAAGWGASDFDGVEGFLDNLDEAYASWMRDIRLGKARLLVAESALTSHGVGQGASFDLDKDVYSALNIPPSEEGKAPITQVQFAIRFAEHKATVDHWTDQIIQSAGYSPATFGRRGDNAAMTATEVDSRERRSETTRGRNVLVWTPQLRRIVTKLATVDAAVFKSGANPEGLGIEFADTTAETVEDRAQAAQLLKAAGAASTETLVRMVHPDWDDTAVGNEVSRILAENASLPDPYGFAG